MNIVFMLTCIHGILHISFHTRVIYKRKHIYMYIFITYIHIEIDVHLCFYHVIFPLCVVQDFIIFNGKSSDTEFST